MKIAMKSSAGAVVSTPRRKPQPKMVSCTCVWCKQPFEARASDRARGWGKFCSKSCKAMKQEKRTGQFRDLGMRGHCGDHDHSEAAHQQALDDSTAGWDEGGWRNDDSGCVSA